MKRPILAFFLASLCSAQTAPSLQQVIAQIQQQMQQNLALAVQTQVTQGMAAITAAIPPAPTPDSVVIMLKATPTTDASTYYARIAACAAEPTCKLVLIGWTCSIPAQWMPSTAYSLGALASSPAGDVYIVSAVAPASLVLSGTANPVWNPTIGATISDGPLTWSFDYANGVKPICTVGAAQ